MSFIVWNEVAGGFLAGHWTFFHRFGPPGLISGNGKATYTQSRPGTSPDAATESRRSDRSGFVKTPSLRTGGGMGRLHPGMLFRLPLSCRLVAGSFSHTRFPAFVAMALATLTGNVSESSAQDAPTSQLAAAHYYSVAPAPDWVTPPDADLSRAHPFETPIRPGIYFRQVDYQVHAEKAEEFFHFTCEYITLAGVHDESSFEVEFDPAYQRLVLHGVRLRRGGEWRDILDQSSIRLTVPEAEREIGLLDGHVTVLVNLRDVQPGDVVEYRYTLAGWNPVFDGRFFDTIPLEWETTVQSMRYRLVKRSDRPLHTKTHGPEIKPDRRQLPDGLEEWVWRRDDIPAKYLESKLPKWYQPFHHVELSELGTWQEVAAWGAKHYDFSQEPLDPGLEAEIDAIRRRHPDVESQALAAIRFVQDSIRYLGIEDGANAFRPAQPSLCYQRRFGDCKDKTVLLALMLRSLGLESDAVCVSHSDRGTVGDHLPSPMAFDHVIARLRLPDGRTFWCDATMSHQGGDLATMHFPDYGKGLVLREDTTALTDLPAPDPDDHRIDVVETYRIGGVGKATEIDIETVYLGSEADDIRYQVETEEPGIVQRRYLDYYRENHVAIESRGPLELMDDREGNRLVIRERYRLPNPWKPDADQSEEGWHTFTIYLQAIRDQLQQVDHTRREMPLRLSHPVHYRQTIHLDLPGTDGDWAGFFDETRHRLPFAAGFYEQETTYDAGKVSATITANYRSDADAVMPEDLPDYETAMNRIYDLTSTELWEVAPGSAAASAPADSPDEESLSDEDIGRLAVVGILAALVAGVIGIAVGAVATALIVNRRRPPTPPARPAASSGPPPLPPMGGLR